MAGIYLHIPFCKKACHYCNFHFSTSLTLKNDFTGALLKEISLQKNYLQGEIIETVYFGGGTPSLLEAPELEAIINRLSIGIQSFFEEDLLWMNRAHNAAQAESCIRLAQKAGFHNLTIDLIYG